MSVWSLTPLFPTPHGQSVSTACWLYSGTDHLSGCCDEVQAPITAHLDGLNSLPTCLSGAFESILDAAIRETWLMLTSDLDVLCSFSA